jgi:N-acetylglucosaminyl-diphospho-decaprenol L-rhamnosyltransferase
VSVPHLARVSWPPIGSDARFVQVLVVIVNFRTATLVIDCLSSLQSEVSELGSVFVVVADNASEDGSVDKLTRAIANRGWDTWARVVPLPRNGGFAYGNNRGLEAGPAAKYVLLLNSDTIVHAGALKHCITTLDASPLIGAMSCNILNRDGSIQNVCRRFPTPLISIVSTLGLPWKLPRLFSWANTEDMGWNRATETRDVDWLGGAFLFIRGSVVAELGCLDEAFFFYGEDVEFSHRLKRHGYRRVFRPGATVTHLGGASSDPSRMPSAARSVHHWQGRYLVQRKCYGRFAAAAVKITDLTILALRVVSNWLLRRHTTSQCVQARETLKLLWRLPWN